VLGPGPHALRRAGEPMADQDADVALTGIVAERLGARQDGHITSR
jgi:hypothetical protein